MAKKKSVFCCSECGNESANWSGRCPSCGTWNTMVEVSLDDVKKTPSALNLQKENHAIRLSEVDMTPESRFLTDISELDRVLGGGVVLGSLILVGGAPGIGKSTLLLQMCGKLSEQRKVLYISGEESAHQIKMRSVRLGIIDTQTYILAETEMQSILASVQKLEPDVVIIDSIQTMFDESVNSAPGSVSQIKECTLRILRMTKDLNITTFVVGHITKEGNLAGPKILEHMVDCVLYFEGERNTSFRILRAVKNRFGSTNEIGVFEMTESGLESVENPSEILLSGRPYNAPGTCVTCTIEGSRPILAEVQALVSPSNYAARRTTGFDYNRTAMLLAVLEKRGGLSVSGCDAYINVVGGLELDEPAADLAVVLAVASSYSDKPLGSDLAAIGEVGLSGEIRSISLINQRIAEIKRLGFRRCVVPYHLKGDTIRQEDIELIRVKNIREAIKAVLE